MTTTTFSPMRWCAQGKHIVDGILKTTLSSLGAFPRFLLRLKAIVKSFRVKLHREAVVRNLRCRGVDAFGNLLENASIVSIADWRGTTLHEACAALAPLIEPLGTHFDPAPFRDGRDLATRIAFA